MRNNAIATVLIAALAVAVLKLASLLVADGAREPEKNAQAAAGKDKRTAVAAANASPPRRDGGERPECLYPSQGKDGQAYLIVTLPDPLISSSGYRFDTLVDALQRAVETRSYVLDSYCYPWKSGGTSSDQIASHGLPLLASLVGSRGNTRQRPKAFPVYQGKPGLLVFRRTDDSLRPKRLVMFLVGETATHGIDQDAFGIALKCLKQRKHGGTQQPIPVLGPFFSGSHMSLAEAIARSKPLCGEQLCFQVISGSATKINGSEFEKRLRKDGIGVCFRTTVHPQTVLRTELMKYLHLTKCGTERIAILEESSTEYGNRAKPANNKPNNKPANNKPANNKPNDNGIHLPFPLHISQVRAAYSRAQTSSGGLPQLPSFSGKLHLPPTEGPDATDTEPSLTPNTTAVVLEQSLAQILSTIARERFKYVVIVATDLKDKIFLATQIRTYFPDIQLVLFGTNLMLSHPDHRAYFKGALVASTYPIYSKNQQWSYPFGGGRRRLLLPDEECQGIYNAAIALLEYQANDLDHLLEYGCPFEKDPCGRYRPPVWISIIGTDGPHPLHSALPKQEDYDKRDKETWDAYEKHVYVAQEPSAQEPSAQLPLYKPRYTGYWVWPCIGVLFFCALAVYWCYEGFLKAINPAAEPWDVRWFLWKDDVGAEQDIVQEPRRYLILCWSALAAVNYYVFVIVVIPLGVWFQKDFVLLEWHDWLLPAIAFIIALCLVLASLLMIATRLAMAAMKAHRVDLLVGVLLVALPVVFVWQARADKPRFLQSATDALLFADRASDLAGGVTPVLPVFFLSMAIFWLGYFQLDRCRLHAQARLGNPFPDPSPHRPNAPLKDISETDKDLNGFLKSPYEKVFIHHWRTTLPALLIFLFIFYRVHNSYVPSVEGVFHDSLMLLAYAVLTLLLAYVFRQSTLLWDRLHDLLRVIAQLPLAKAFDRLPKAVTETFGPYLSSESPRKKSQDELPLQQLRALALQYGSVRERLQKTFHLTVADLTNLDKELWYDPVTTPQTVQTNAQQKWQTAGRPDGQSLHCWLAAEMEEARDRIEQHTSPTPPQPPLSQQDFTRAARACLQVLDACWKHVTVGEGHADPALAEKGDKTAAEAADLYLARLGDLAAPLEAGSIKALQSWLHMAEDFAAIEITAYLSQFFVHLRKLARSLTWASLLAILAIVSYPLQPQRLMLTIAGVLVILLMGYALYIFVHIEWDEVVSRIQKSTPQHLDLSWKFVRSVVVFIVPVLGVLAATSADLSDLLHTLLDPIYQVMK